MLGDVGLLGLAVELDHSVLAAGRVQLHLVHQRIVSSVRLRASQLVVVLLPIVRRCNSRYCILLFILIALC
jgi:hypothetical protein